MRQPKANATETSSQASKIKLFSYINALEPIHMAQLLFDILGTVCGIFQKLYEAF